MNSSTYLAEMRQLARYAWIIHDGEQLRRERINRDGGSANNLPPSDK